MTIAGGGSSRARRGRRALAWALTAAAPLCGPATAVEIALSPGCAASSALAAELVEPRAVGARCGGDAACWRTALTSARATRDRFEGEYDAHRVYLLVARAAARTLGGAILAPLREEYSALAAAHPANPAYAHLSAQLALEGAEYRLRLEDLVARFPDYPWAHLSLAFQARTSADAKAWEGARGGLERFLRLCPERVLDAAHGLEMVGDRALIAEHAGRLRALALARGEAEALSVLWPLSIRAAEDARRAAEIEAVEAELVTFAAGAEGGSFEGLRALQIGHDAVGDREGRARAEDDLLALAPCGDEAVRIRSARFREAHPPVTEGDEAARQAWRESALAEVARALDQCPSDEAALGLRVDLLAGAPAARDAELLAAVDRLLALPPRRLELPPSLPGWEAGLYLDRGLRLERVAGLLDLDLADARADHERATAEGGGEAAARFAWRRRWNLRSRTRLALALGEVAGARRALAELAEETSAAPSGGRAPAFRGVPLFPDERTALDLLAARVATAEGRGGEALERLARLLPDPILRPVLEDGARAAWRAARGGSEEGFEDWVEGLADGPAAAPWTAVDVAVPPTPLTEFGGGPWDWAARRGQTVVVGLWATWCGPCREQLPWLERLKERLKDRSDVSVIALNVERTNGKLIPFLADSGPALPVLLGGDGLFDEGLAGVPAVWIVAPDGRVRRELRGFAGGGEEWLAAALAEIEAVAAPAPVASGGS